MMKLASLNLRMFFLHDPVRFHISGPTPSFESAFPPSYALIVFGLVIGQAERLQQLQLALPPPPPRTLRQVSPTRREHQDEATLQ